MILNYVIFFASAVLIDSKNLPANSSAVLISKYAKVAHWGTALSTTQEPQSEGRSNRDQSSWTHRMTGSQNLKSNKPSVVYQYPVQRKPSRKSGNVKEVLPAVGEVQDRFNPRPYFDYGRIPPKSEKTESTLPAPSFDSFPVFKLPPESSEPPKDLYQSSYSSYNPPKSSEDSGPPDVAYPPNAPPPPDDGGNAQPDSPGYSYDPPKEDQSPNQEDHPSPHYEAPKEEPPQDDQTPPHSFSFDSPKPHPGYSYPKPDHPLEAYPSLGPPLAPEAPEAPKEQLYYPPPDNHEVILDHPPPGYEDSKPDMMMGDSMRDMGDSGMASGPSMADSGMNSGSSMADSGMAPGHDMAEQDLSPPPSNEGRFPGYLYSDPHGSHDFDSFYDHDHHHVYKEVTTTTTTEAPEDERVSKDHYSYYYLGRKLWYIPLYFSVYFIIYVAVLILKSIARHKIQFKHNYNFNRKAKELSFNDELNDLHRNVTTAIDAVSRKVSYVAM